MRTTKRDLTCHQIIDSPFSPSIFSSSGRFWRGVSSPEKMRSNIRSSKRKRLATGASILFWKCMQLNSINSLAIACVESILLLTNCTQSGINVIARRDSDLTYFILDVAFPECSFNYTSSSSPNATLWGHFCHKRNPSPRPPSFSVTLRSLLLASHSQSIGRHGGRWWGSYPGQSVVLPCDGWRMSLWQYYHLSICWLLLAPDFTVPNGGLWLLHVGGQNKSCHLTLEVFLAIQ